MYTGSINKIHVNILFLNHSEEPSPTISEIITIRCIIRSATISKQHVHRDLSFINRVYSFVIDKHSTLAHKNL